MPKIPTKRAAARRASRLLIRRKRMPWPRRSSYLEPSAETLASLNEDTAKLRRYRTAEELIRSLEEDPPTP